MRKTISMLLSIVIILTFSITGFAYSPYENLTIPENASVVEITEDNFQTVEKVRNYLGFFFILWYNIIG